MGEESASDTRADVYWVSILKKKPSRVSKTSGIIKTTRVREIKE